MSILSESYSNFISPINTGATNSRAGGDKINISFSKGKKSNKDILEELAIARAQRELKELELVPVGERYNWEAEDRKTQTQLRKEAAIRDEAANLRAEAAASRAAAAENFELADRIKNAPIEYKSKAATLNAQEFSNFLNRQAYDKAAAAESRDQDLRRRSLTYDIAAGNPDTGRPWATVTPSQVRRSMDIMESIPMPEYRARNARQNIQLGMDPISAYLNSSVTYTGRNPNMPYSRQEREQFQDNDYRQQLAQATGGYDDLRGAYARMIANSGIPRNMRGTQGYKWYNGQFVPAYSI